MQRRNRGATAALLQKANSQLRGEKIEKPEDELNAYISSLTQKTVKSQKSVNFEDFGDSISISSDIEDAPKQETTSMGGSKFMKKKPSFEEPVSSSPAPTAHKFLKKPQASSPSPSVTAKNRYGSQPVTGSLGSTGQLSRSGTQLGGPSRQASSVLDKMSALTGKIQERAATRKSYALEADSDESFSGVKISGSGDMLSESQTSDSVKVGRDGGKFLKKAPGKTATSIEPPLNTQSTKTRPSLIEQPKKATSYQLKSAQRYSTDVVLTSEEESLAEFVGGLPSSSDSFDKPRNQQRSPHRKTPSPTFKAAKGRQSPSPTPQKTASTPQKGKGRSVSPPHKPPVVRRTPSPSPRSPGLRRRTPSPKLVRSQSDDSNIAESIQDEVAEDFDIGLNVIMDLDDLGPVDELPSLSGTPPGSEAVVRSTARKSDQASKKSTKAKDSGSPFKSSKQDKSPFRAAEVNNSPFKSSSNKEKSMFKSGGGDSPFKASNKEIKSPFKKSDNDSPFKAKGSSSSPFRASKEGSVFKASANDSPFKSSSYRKQDLESSGSLFKASSLRSASPVTERSESKSVNRKKGRKGRKDEKKNKKSDKKPKNDLFSAFGIQTVDDLLGGNSVSALSAIERDSYADDPISEVSEEIKTERVYNTVGYDNSASEIPSEVDEIKPGYTDDFDSISEKIGYASDKGRSSASEVQTKYSGDDTQENVTDYSDTETDTRTYSRTITDTETRTEDEREDQSYVSYSEDFTRSMVPTVSRSNVTPHPRKGMISAEVQTTLDGLYYSWDAMGAGMTYPGVPYGLHFVDPTPIAAHVVSADALESMTAYSPAMLALHDMLKSQLELTKEFIAVQKQFQTSKSDNIQPRYHYTTLEDTKRYIQKNKKKRLTFKEALRLVDIETARTKS